MANFTPVSGFLGGILIGLAAALLLLANGRIAGISGAPRASSRLAWNQRAGALLRRT